MPANMTIELVKILEAAHEYDKAGNDWFILYSARAEKYGCESEEANMYWKFAKEATDKALAMLEAYEIITGKHITLFTLDEELALA